MTPSAAAKSRSRPAAAAAAPTVDSEITWLLHRAAQRMRTVVGQAAEERGVQLRDHIVLSALHKSPELSQIELGRTLGLDKTTLTSQLDRLERAGLVERRPDPHDRRARIPHLTRSGESVRRKVAAATDRIELAELSKFDDAEVALLRRLLIGIIGDSDDPGSCL